MVIGGIIAGAGRLISRVISRSPVSKVPGTRIARSVGNSAFQTRAPVTTRLRRLRLPRRRRTRGPIVSRGPTSPQRTPRTRGSRAGRVLRHPATVIGGATAAGFGADVLLSEGGTKAGAVVGAVAGGFSPAGRIKRIGGGILGGIGGGFSGTVGADIAEAQDIGVSRGIDFQGDTPIDAATSDLIPSETDEAAPAPRRKSTPKKTTSKKTTSKKKKSSSRSTSQGKKNMKKAQMIMKESGKKWRKMSKATKRKYENKFSDYVKVQIEKGISAKIPQKR